MNEHDSLKIKLILKDLGYESIDAPESADLILFNTCTIREKAHHKAISELGRAKKLKERKSDMLIGVCGCVAQQDKEGLFKKYPYVDILFGPDQISRLPELLAKAQNNAKASALTLIDAPDEYVFPNNIFMTQNDEFQASAFVSIMKGCNCACAYCIVPSVRGREVCRTPEDILDEIRSLVAIGNKEVVLLGQNVNAYHSKRSKSRDGDLNFSDLIRKISVETDVTRIRFTSPHPKDVGDDLIREYHENPKLCPHIHLPLQSGSNETLRRMRRGYTRERYIKIASKLRESRADISITTDLIVGFCGESDRDFRDTYDLMKEVEFDSIFAFKYSPRPGTYAYDKLQDDVPSNVKEERLEQLLCFQREITQRKNKSLIGSSADVLVYSQDRMNRGLLTGRIPDNRIVHFSGHSDLIGDIISIKIMAANKNSLVGEIKT